MKRPDIRRLPKRGNPQEAVNLLLSNIDKEAVKTETVQLTECLGRVLAEDVFSNLNMPDYDKTFIDGYAICSQETRDASSTKPASFKIVGKLFPPDYPTSLQIRRGQAVYVACGAPIPQGASATVKVEETRLHEDRIEVVREIQAGEGIIPLGDDFKKGDLLLKKGQVLRPPDIGLLASTKLTAVEVYKKPTISIISGGDELLKQSHEDPNIIANNYALVIAGFASELGATPKLLGIMPDDLNQVTKKIAAAIEISDIVVTIGGSSVGVKDFVPDAINALGKPGVVVQGILLRPGAISGFGYVKNKPIVMLPGHIGSCIAGFFLFMVPLINSYIGLETNTGLPKISAVLTEKVETGPQYRFLLVQLRKANGKFEAEPTKGGSSALTTIAKSKGFAIVPPHVELETGSELEISLFNKLGLI